MASDGCGWKTVTNMLGVFQHDLVWCTIGERLISLKVKYHALSLRGAQVTISDSVGVLDEHEVSVSTIRTSSLVVEKEVNVHNVGLVKVRWGPWRLQLFRSGVTVGPDWGLQQVSFWQHGRQIYCCQFNKKERKPVPAALTGQPAEAGKAGVPAGLIYEAVKVSTHHVNYETTAAHVFKTH
jgi:hypothetical protein